MPPHASDTVHAQEDASGPGSVGKRILGVRSQGKLWALDFWLGQLSGQGSWVQAAGRKEEAAGGLEIVRVNLVETGCWGTDKPRGQSRYGGSPGQAQLQTPGGTLSCQQSLP